MFGRRRRFKTFPLLNICAKNSLFFHSFRNAFPQGNIRKKGFAENEGSFEGIVEDCCLGGLLLLRERLLSICTQEDLRAKEF